MYYYKKTEVIGMAIREQARLLKAFGDMLIGDPTKALSGGGTLKADFPSEYTMEYLPRSTPEEEGVSSAWIADFLVELSAAPYGNIHDFSLMRHGKVISEGDFSPYRRDIWHVTHSLCKSFTGTAVGFALGEKLFSLEDSVVDYFGDKIGLFSSKKWKEVTIRHLLTMSSGIVFNEISQALDNDWLKSIFSAEPAFRPGTRFVYNSINSYVLSALVCRTSGETLSDYLEKRLFKPLGFGPVFWETSAEGFEKGGWGMYVLPEDMAKLGQLYLQKGCWNIAGKMKQILPKAWVRQATKSQIPTGSNENYGYHFWVDEKMQAFLASGMFGQYIIVFPKLDIVLTFTSGNPNLFAASATYTVVEKFFTKLTLEDTLPAAPLELASLQKITKNLAFQKSIVLDDTSPKRATAKSKRERLLKEEQIKTFCGTTWKFPENRGGLLPAIAQCMNFNMSAGVKAIRFEEIEGALTLFWEEGENTLSFPIGFDKPAKGTANIRNQNFIISTKGEIAYDEDNFTVLKVLVCPLELTSARIIKFRKVDRNISLEMDEIPQFSVAISSAMRQNSTTSKNDSSNSSNPFARFGFVQDFVSYKIDQICTPRITGTPVKINVPNLEEVFEHNT